jgi:hypothetical protein
MGTNTYTFTFIGRKVGAIGITYRITVTTEADSVESAKAWLWEHYEHITQLEIKEN